MLSYNVSLCSLIWNKSRSTCPLLPQSFKRCHILFVSVFKNVLSMSKHKKLKNLVKHHVLSGISDCVSTSGTFFMLPSILFLLQQTATTIFYSWDGVPKCTSVRLFQTNVATVIMTKQYFSFIRSQNTSPKVEVFAPVCICKLQSDFLCFFWCVWFLLAEGSFSPPWYWTRLTVNNERVLCALASIFTRSLDFVLGSICTISTFISGRQDPSPSWAKWWLDIRTMSILAYNCLNGWMRQRQASEKHHNSLPNIWASFMWLSHHIKQGSSIFQVWT